MMKSLAVHDLDLRANSELTFDLQRFNEATPPPAETTPPPADGATPPPAEGTPPPATETKPPAEGTTPPPADPPADPPPAEPVTYEFKLPEGIEIDPEINVSLQATLNDLKIPKDKAQGLIDLQLKVVEKQQKAVADYVARETAEREAWLGSGTERGLRLENIERGWKHLDPTGDLKQLLDSAHLGQNKLLAQSLARIGAAAKEGPFESGSSGGEKSWAETMYNEK